MSANPTYWLLMPYLVTSGPQGRQPPAETYSPSADSTEQFPTPRDEPEQPLPPSDTHMGLFLLTGA